MESRAGGQKRGRTTGVGQSVHEPKSPPAHAANCLTDRSPPTTEPGAQTGGPVTFCARVGSCVSVAQSAVRAGELAGWLAVACLCCLLCCLCVFLLWQFGDKRDRHTRLAACVACRPAVKEAGQRRGRGWREGSVWFLRLFFRLVSLGLVIAEGEGGTRPWKATGSDLGSRGRGQDMPCQGQGPRLLEGRLLAQLGCVCVSVPCAFANLLAASCSQ